MREELAPIGIFDSGVGGLTVVRAILRRYSHERILYVADQAHVPYGERPLEDIRRFAGGISDFLAEQGCKAIVMACNISSACALPSIAAKLAPLPIFGMIDPAVRRAVEVDPQAAIGVLATTGTVRSGAYTTQIRALNPQARVIEVACPRFVPLVEAGELYSQETMEAAYTYLMPLARAECRTIILGCTHYPFLLPTLRRAAADLFPGPVRFIDPAEETAQALEGKVPPSQFGAARHLLLTTGDVSVFASQIPCFLPGFEYEIAIAHWSDNRRLSLAGLPISRASNTVDMSL
ncbi:MAG TPA: glutamate racemase [Chthonomonadales bacterium]|nr:glutamate racemase [Chthonomonadales bacterium]